MTVTPRTRSLLKALFTSLALAAATAIIAAGNLASVSPTGASSGVPLAINGTGFNTTATQNEVTFTHVSGQVATAVPSRVVVGTGVLRLTVTVPTGLPVGRADLRVLNRATGEVSEGLWIDVLHFKLTGSTSAQRGASAVAVAIEGSPNSKFVAGTTRAVFGTGVTVHSTTVTSPTALVATISVADTAALGPRPIGVTSPNQQAIVENAFTITPAGTPSNSHPTVTSTPPTSATEGQPYTYDVGASDPDSTDALTYSLTTAPTGMSIDPASGLIEWTPAASHVPSVQVVVQVLDGKGGSATQSFTINVTAAPPPNQQPLITSTPVTSATEGQPYVYDVDASDPDAGDTLSYTLTQAPAGMTVDAATGVISWLPSPTPATVSVTVVVGDGRTGSATQSFTIAVAPATLGRGVLTGWVFDDATGLPIQNASAQPLDASGAPATVLPVTSDTFGRYRLSVAAGTARVRVTKEGFTAADLAVTVVDGRRVEPDDARLTMLNSATPVVSSVAGGSVVHGGARVTFAPASFNEDRIVRVTEVGIQGAIRRLPLGWNPLAVVDVSAGSGVMATTAQLRARVTPIPPVGREVTLAKWDHDSGSWVALAAATRSTDGTSLEGEIPGSGQYAFTMADVAPNAPPIPVPGSALTGLSPRPPPVLTLTLNPAPRILFAQSGARSLVSAAATPSEPLPSGTPLQVDLTESFTFANGSVLRPMPGRRRLGLYGASDGQSSLLRAAFGVGPSRALTPFSLREGAIDLAGKLPADPFAPRGRVIGGQGGEFTAASGERVIVPPGSSPEDLPIDVRTIAIEDFPLTVPAGVTLLRSFLLDLHGAPLTRDVQVVLPSTISVPTGSAAMVVQLVDVGDATRLVLVAMALPQAGGLVTTVDPLGDGSVRLPGLRTEGRYAVLVASGNFGFVTGEVRSAEGVALGGALVEGVNAPVAAMSDSSGRYTLLLPAGPVDVRVTNPANGDTALINAQVTGNFAVTNRPASLGASPPVIVAVTPGNGATKVPLGSSVTVTFSEPIDPATVTAGVLTLASSAGPVAGTLALAPGNVALTFRPAALLQSHTLYTLSVAATIRDTAGHALATPFGSQFTTVDVTPPAPPPAGTVVASIPDAAGTTTVTGSQGTADPGGVVVIRNLRNNALTTLTPNADGSFSGVVSALRTDRLEMTIRDAAGNETTVPVAAFRNADGAVVVGAGGGRVEGPGGIFVEVPPGALPDGTIVHLAPVPPSELPLPAPADFPVVNAVRLDLGGAIAAQELDLAVPAPPDATLDEQILVARAITIPSGPAWTLAERAQLTGDKYQTASRPFPGVMAGGIFAFLRPGGCVSYISLIFNHYANVLMSVHSGVGGGNPFIYTSDVQSVVLANRCDTPLRIQVVDTTINSVLQEITTTTPVTQGAIGEGQRVTYDQVPPRLLHAETFQGNAVPYVELTFSEPMDWDSVRPNLRVEGPDGFVNGRAEAAMNFTVARFVPDVPFTFGKQYHIRLSLARDPGFNTLDDVDIPFTPVDPSRTAPVVVFEAATSFTESLKKCIGAACNTSVRDTARFGNVLFLANGLANANERYSQFPPHRLIAVDIKQPNEPLELGWTGRPTNPRVLAAIQDAAFTTPQGLSYRGDLLLVASGGRIIDNVELATRVEVYDVRRCTREPRQANCLEAVDTVDVGDSLPARRGEKLLSTPTGQAVVAGVPVESGVPQQMAVLHQRGPAGTNSDVVVAYVIVSGVGLVAIDVTKSFNLRPDTTPNYAPDGIMRGDFLDVAVIRNRVYAVEVNPLTGASSLAVYSAQLTDKQTIPLPGPAARIAALETLVVDLEPDGRVGSAEATPGEEDLPGRTIDPGDEVFDLAVVASGPVTTGCAGNVTPCGELYILDVAGLAVPGHDAVPRVVERIPLPGPAFSIQIDPQRLVAYVEIRGHGLAVIDLTHVRHTLRTEVEPPSVLNASGRDGRVLTIVAKSDIFTGEVHVDTARGIAFVNGSASGLSILRVADCCTELSLDFNDERAADPQISPTGFSERDRLLEREKQLLFGLLQKAYRKLETAGIAVRTPNPDPDGSTSTVSMLEQGSGACFWRPEFDSFPNGPSKTCSAFDPPTSDHDIEVFVPKDKITDSQALLDEFITDEIKDKQSDIHKIGPLTLYAFSKEAFESGELLVSTPINKSGDGSGDLAMGRQTLLLLWLLEGEYVETSAESFKGRELFKILTDFQLGPILHPNPVLEGEPSNIPRLEGHEWSLLQEYNLHKSGALLRLARVCESGGGTSRVSALSDVDPNDPENNFDDNELFKDDCVEQLRTVGKAGIRAVMARLLANEKTNPTVLEVSLFNYRSATGCQTKVPDPAHPPTDPLFGYSSKPCGSFEEYIASKAIESVRNGIGPFRPADLPVIYTFFCVKVWDHCKDEGNNRARILTTDREINAFIASTLAFITAAQVETLQAYSATVALDTKTLKEVGFTDAALLEKVRTLCAQHGFTDIGLETHRSVLRQCNRAIVERKVNGDPAIPVDPPLPIEVITDKDRRTALGKRFGAKGMVFRFLRVRAVNSGSTAVRDAVVRLYEGDGLTRSAYTSLKRDHTIENLAEGSSHVLDAVTDGPAYPIAFRMSGLAPNAARALSFFLDPDRRFPEQDKSDNHAAFFYYRLDPAAPGGPPGLPARPVLPIADAGPDVLCLPPSDLELTVVAQFLSDTEVPGSKEISVRAGEPVLLRYTLKNKGATPLSTVTISRTEAPLPVYGPAVVQPDVILTPTDIFVPTRPGVYELVARAYGLDPQGNWVSARPSRVRVNALAPQCEQSIVPLDPDPNPIDAEGLARSTVMLGGRLFRYYRLIDKDGNPKPDTLLKIEKRQLPGGEFVRLTDVVTGENGLIVHMPLGATTPEPGLRLDAAQLGEVGPRFEVRVYSGDAFGPCDVSFQAEVTPRQFTAAIRGGVSIEAEGAIEVKLAGRAGSGFEFKLNRHTLRAGDPPVDTKATVTRTMEAALGIGAKPAATKAGVKLGSEISLRPADANVAVNAVLMLRDRHEFETPLGLVQGAAVGQLLLGLIAVSATVGVPNPAGPMMALGLNALAERVAGLDDYRRGIGGGVGLEVKAGASSTPDVPLSVGGRKVTFKIEGNLDAAAIGAIDILTPATGPVAAEPSLEYRAAFNVAAVLGLAAEEESADVPAQEAAAFEDAVKFLEKLFQASANFAGTLRLAVTLDVENPMEPRLKGVTISVAHKKNYGFNAAGQPIAGGGDNKVRRLTFRITDRDPARLVKALQTLAGVQELSEQPAQVLLGPAFAAQQLVKVMRLADEYDQRIEEGKTYTRGLGLNVFLEGVGLGGDGDLKLESIGTHVTQVGTFRRNKRYRLAEYDEVDPVLIPPSGFDRAIDTIRDLEQIWKQVTRGYQRVTQAVGAGRELVQMLFGSSAAPEPEEFASGPSADAQPSPAAGVELDIDGAAESGQPPLVVDLIGFQYRHKPEATGVSPGDASAVSGDSSRPHYGIGGFFHFAPSERALGAPARLTIRYLDAEVGGFEESSLAIYRWNNVSQDWDRLGGTVDATANTITVEVSRLGLYTAAPAMPVGSIAMTPDVAAGGTLQAPTSITTFTSQLLRLNSGAIVPDGTLFTVRPLAGNQGSELTLGTILTSDTAPAIDGVQVMSQGGVVRFVAELPGSSGFVVPLVFSVEGTAIADRAYMYQRPQ